MQNLFSISKGWYDPVSGLTRAITVIFAVLVVESSAFLLRDKYPQVSPIFLLGFIRAVDISILLMWGPWSFKKTDIAKAVKDTLFITLFFTVSGLLFLICWKNVFGSSMLRVNNRIFRQNWDILIAFYITRCLISPVAEELVFRGILYRKMREKWNWWISTGVVSLVFALIHLYFNNQSLVPFLGSLIFCFGYEKTKFILAPIFLHISGNLIILLSPFLSFI